MEEFDLEIPEALYEPEAAYSVNKELNLAWEIIEHTGANLFLTGRAGTGKTTFLKKLRKDSQKNMVVLAPTGVAAINASGSTIHSFFQLPFSPYIPGEGFVLKDKKHLNMSKMKRRLIASLSLLVIDEISMVRPDTLDAIDSILRRLRNSSRPFAGMQLLLIGDLRQLSPVVKKEEWDMLAPYYSSQYFFESHALKRAGYQTLELSTVYRQSDRFFLDILNKIRSGSIDTNSLSILNEQCNPKFKSSSDEEGYIRLTTHNKRAAKVNKERLDELETPEFVFEAEVEGNFPETSFPSESKLVLKEGAQVMFLKNDIGADRKFYNGMIGKVVSLSEEKILVKALATGQVIEVPKMEWENSQFVLNEITNTVSQETLGIFRQYPLQLAWAITIHKSQGLTFDKAIIDAANSFASGQAYVALSRCRSIEGMVLETPLAMKSIIIDREVNDFVAYCDANAPDAYKVDELKDRYQMDSLAELFDFESLRRSFMDLHRGVVEYVIPLYPEIEKEADQMKVRMESAISGVAQKFIHSYNKVQIKGDKYFDSEMLSRIRNGCKYFLENIKEIQYFLNGLNLNLDNKGYQERLTNLKDSLSHLLSFHMIVLRYMAITDFSVAAFLSAKAKAFGEVGKGDKSKAFQYIKAKKSPAVSKKKEVTPKEKKPRGYSLFETLKLFKQGKNYREIASLRNLKESTISDHLVKLVAIGRLQLEDLADKSTIEKLRKTIRENDNLPWKELFEKSCATLGINDLPEYLFRLCRMQEPEQIGN